MKRASQSAQVNVKVLIALLVTVCVLCGGAAVAYKVRKHKVADEALEKAKTALAAEDWPAACEHLKLYLSKYPDDEEMLRRYAEAHLAIRPLQVNNVGSAIAAYRRVLRTRPGDEEISRKLANLYFDIRDYHEAIYICRQRLEADPKDKEIALLLGRSLFMLHKADDAQEVLARAVEEHPDLVDAYPILSTLAMRGDAPSIEEALKWLDIGVQKNPDSAKALAYRGRFQRLVRQDRNAAKNDIEAADALQPQDPAVMLLVAEEWMYLNEPARCEAQLARLDALKPEDLAAHGVSEADLNLGVWTTKARLAIRTEADGGEKIADRGLAALKERRRERFMPLAIELYVIAEQAERARETLGEFRRSLEARGPVGNAEEDELAFLGAMIDDLEGRPAEVVHALEPITLRSPDHYRAWHLLGQAYMNLGKATQAAEAFEAYLGGVPDDAGTMVLVARAYREQNPSKSAMYAARAEKLEPGRLSVTLLRIDAQMDANRSGAFDPKLHKRLLDELTEIRAARPKDVQVATLWAKAAAIAGMSDEVTSVLGELIETGDDSYAAAMQLSGYLRSLGRLDSAIEVCERAVSQQPDSATPRLFLAQLQMEADRPEEARSTLESGIEALSGEQRLAMKMSLAEFAMAHEGREAGIALLESWMAEEPDNVRIPLRLLRMPEVQGDPERAARLLERLRQVEGEDGTQWKLQQARLWFRAPDWITHREEIEKYLAECRESDPKWVEPIILLAAFQDRLGDGRRAAELYRLAYETDPSAPEAASRLLAILERQGRFSEADGLLKELPATFVAATPHEVNVAIGRGDYERAIRELEQRIAEDPQDANARIVLARLSYAHEKDADLAMRLLDEAAKIAPEHRSIVSTRAWILRQTGRSDEAVALLDAHVDQHGDYFAHLLRAEYYAEAGEDEKAEADYRYLAGVSGLEAEGNLALARFYHATGLYSDAAEAAEQGLAAAPGHLGLERILIRSLIDDPADAARQRGRELLERRLVERPEDSELLALQASLLLYQGTIDAQARGTAFLEKAVKIDPRNVAAHARLIRLAFDEGDLELARQRIAAGLAANPNNPEILLSKAQLEWHSGNLLVARTLAESVTLMDSENVAAVNLLAELALAEGDVEAAEAMNRKALDIDGRSDDARVTQAWILALREQTDEAIKVLETHCATDGGRTRVRPLLVLATLLCQEGEFAAAEERLEKASRLNPRSPQIAAEEVRCLRLQGRLDEMTALLDEKILSRRPIDWQVVFEAVEALTGSGKEQHLQAAKSILEEALQLSPGELRGREALAHVAYLLGDFALVEKSYREILERDGFHQKALNDLAWILNENLHRPEEALELVNRGVSQYSDDPHLLDTRGVILRDMNRTDEARRDLERSVETAVQEPATRARALLHLAQLEHRLRNFEAVREHLQRALLIDGEQSVFSAAERQEIARLEGEAKQQSTEVPGGA